MNRRSFLAATGVTLTTATAGCTSSSSDEPTTTPDGPVHSTAVSEDNIEVSVGQWGRKNEVRYYDSDADQTKLLDAENGAFYDVNLTVNNLGERSKSVPSLTNFNLWVAGEAFPLLTELPDNVSWEKLRNRDDKRVLNEPFVATDRVKGGESAFPNVSYDASAKNPAYIKWTPSGKVEGEDAVFLELGQRITG
ncbi:hypothetical protein [Halorussus sp. MSC15.2]|uniref:hypothetical protein n=1 Tax=Halorussus sp. MSC15.2 TaxID=2283638 RepID=UPI0013D0C9B5|nr:hypothetical protein [Halorussus sp. MSC15.2]NEU56739.1 hypothetical protein [Halorussus sp. MSC15.2]